MDSSFIGEQSFSFILLRGLVDSIGTILKSRQVSLSPALALQYPRATCDRSQSLPGP